jgi:hypothetical protein
MRRTRGLCARALDARCDEETLSALRDFAGWENCDERIRNDDRIDPEALDDMRLKHGICSRPKDARARTSAPDPRPQA